jgi:hypothetical protein
LGLKMLLEIYPEGASVQDNDGKTPYDVAVRWKHKNAIKKILLDIDPSLDRRMHFSLKYGCIATLYYWITKKGGVKRMRMRVATEDNQELSYQEGEEGEEEDSDNYLSRTDNNQKGSNIEQSDESAESAESAESDPSLKDQSGESAQSDPSLINTQSNRESNRDPHPAPVPSVVGKSSHSANSDADESGPIPSPIASPIAPMNQLLRGKSYQLREGSFKQETGMESPLSETEPSSMKVAVVDAKSDRS